MNPWNRNIWLNFVNGGMQILRVLDQIETDDKPNLPIPK